MTRRRRPALRPGATVLFESWRGRYSDSPRAVSEEIGRRGLDVRRFWSVEGDVELPPGVIGVRRNSPGYLRRLLTADVVVSNDLLARYYHKPPWTTYVQTWHGTPLKRIGFDHGDPAFAGGQSYLRHLARDAATWDLLLSTSPFTTEAFRRSFRYDGEVLEAGYPRNDRLHGPDVDRERAELRARLGIPSHHRVLLYAPTWRDDTRDAEGRTVQEHRLDTDELRRALGTDWTLLVRLHRNVAGGWGATDPDGFVRDLSGWPDIQDLYLVTDVLVTDYSSVMFDFAVTGRPMLFFTYDLERYRDELRGFCFDFAAEAPGPLVATTTELLRELSDLDGLVQRYAAPYRDFAARFGGGSDGSAATHVVDRLLTPT